MSMDFPPQFQNWDKTDPASLFGALTMKKEANPKVPDSRPPPKHPISWTPGKSPPTS